jgi:hypothetical protein
MHDARCYHAAAARAPLGLGDLQEEVTLHICGFLSVRELGRLACASRRFGRPSDWPITAGGPVVARRSLVDEAARRWVLACSAEQQAWVARSHESWLRRMQEVVELRAPLVFSQAHANINLTEEGTVATMTTADGGDRAAASGSVLRGGRHHARFTLLRSQWATFVGVIRGGWDAEGGNRAFDVKSHCFHNTANGYRYPGPNHDWEGMQGAVQGDTIGLTLDLEEGAMTVYKNGEELGVMATGLQGGYVWAVSMFNAGDSICIESGPTVPPGLN